MSTAYELHGRTAQKQRTRRALVDAARELLAAGQALTVESAADAASISRTTAYRYFPNRRALLAAAYPVTERASLLPDDPPADAETRLELVLTEFHRGMLESEVQLRTALRLALEPGPHESDDLPLRRGRAIRWLTEALEPDRALLGDDGVRRLVLAIRASTGIESLVWMVDVAGLSSAEAVQVMRWTARALYRTAVAEARAGSVS